MRVHHTKTKGDLGVLHVQLDLAKKGYGILVPLTEHESFDLVAYRGSCFLRVQVKYRALTNGTLVVPMSTTWTDRHGIHTSPIDRTNVDLIAVFCPETERCYYVDPNAFAKRCILRVTPPRNQQRLGIVWAADYLEIPESVCGVSPPPLSPRGT